jgi:hypothetical protein
MAIINNFINLNIRNILLLAIFLRVLWAYIVPVDPVADSFLYNEFAKSIASGNGYAFPNGDITVYWPVGTSAIYAVLYKVFGVSFLPIVLICKLCCYLANINRVYNDFSKRINIYFTRAFSTLFLGIKKFSPNT